MKFVILAAGKGTRLSPLTDEKPKCMVQFKNKPIIDYIIDNALSAGIQEKDMVVIGGYKFEILKNHLQKYKSITFVENTQYDTTNMVSTLFCYDFNEEIIISYSDILYTSQVLEKTVLSQGNGIVVDTKWKDIWTLRFGHENILSDAETLTFNEDGKTIKSLGQKPSSLDEIEAQYTGIIKFHLHQPIKTHYQDMKRNLTQKEFDNMYMTDFLQSLIDMAHIQFQAIKIEGNFLEIDSKEDLTILEQHVRWI